MKLRPMVLPWHVYAQASIRLVRDAVPLASLEPCNGLGVWLPVPVGDFTADTLVTVGTDNDAMRIASFHSSYLPCYRRRNGRARLASPFYIVQPGKPPPRDLAWLVPIIGRGNPRPTFTPTAAY